MSTGMKSFPESTDKTASFGSEKRKGRIMKRILLKLSGEALAGSKKTGFDEETVLAVARQIKAIAEEGTRIGIVIGGGNFWRGTYQ